MSRSQTSYPTRYESWTNYSGNRHPNYFRKGGRRGGKRVREYKEFVEAVTARVITMMNDFKEARFVANLKHNA